MVIIMLMIMTTKLMVMIIVMGMIIMVRITDAQQTCQRHLGLIMQ